MDIIMENKKDKLKASLESNLPTVSKAKPLAVDKDIKDDYEFSRKTYKDLINTGVGSLDILAELARESEHPRAFEVLSQAIKNIGDTTDKLMSLQKAKKELNKEEKEKEDLAQVTNNNVFVGSTTDLQRLLAQENEKIINHAEDKE
jgi:hypothetical protein|tara:strand:- start:1686 stop:2123 length:438 start_codon:yes stop_codon:yes gene_type:complete